MKELLANLDTLSINLGAGEMFVVNIILAVVMFGVALGIKVQTFKDVFQRPTAVLAGVTLQYFVLPAVTCLLAIVLNPIITPMVAIGMILVASCPGGNISNFMTSLSKGNVELSVSMTAITTALASFVTPLNFWFWGTIYCRFASVRNDIPTLEIPFMDMLHQILLILGIPIIVGMLCAHYLPNFSKRIVKPLQWLSILLFMGMVAVSLTQVLTALEARWAVYASILAAFLVVIIHNATALTSGYTTARLLKLPEADCRSLTIETGIQNSGLGLALLFNPAIFDPTVWSSNGGMVLITALWGVWHIVSGLTVATIFRRRKLA
ncbi:MAG: bile acid:sodium symporter family protein [Alistipes sp.]|nr:bile acid:sodium symporter family protein [Alistipes sp.]MBR5585531.1 bile acid:sodium symporter family protein [Alistipes sp.]